MWYFSRSNFVSRIEGDASIAKRPMQRVIDPLTQMGALVESKQGFPPLIFHPSSLQGISYHSPIASAQVKSCLLLAGLYAQGKMIVHEPYLSRNHTELMLQYFSQQLSISEKAGRYSVQMVSQNQLQARSFHIPGDISSAAFFIVAALISPGGHIKLTNVGINPTRRGIIDILLRMGARIHITNVKDDCEVTADLIVEHSSLKGILLNEADVASIIDEIPILAVAAVYAEGMTSIRGASELRVKESDRITSIVTMISSLGGQVKEYKDGLDIKGTSCLLGGEVNSFDDHRIAMATAIAALNCTQDVCIWGAKCIATSFPTFFELYAHFKGERK